MNEFNLHTEAAAIVADYLPELMADIESIDDAREAAEEWAHETADGHQWVIYTYQAGQLIANNDHDDGEQWLADCYGAPYDGCETIADVHTRLAFAMLYTALMDAMTEALDEWPGYVVGNNMPGYMPDAQPDEYDTWTEARDALVAMMEEEAEEAEETAEDAKAGSCDADCADNALGLRQVSKHHATRAEALRQAVVHVEAAPAGDEVGMTVHGQHFFLAEASATIYRTTAGGVAYWLQHGGQ